MLVMILVIILNLEGIGYTKEITRIEYEWEPPRCNACLIFGRSLDCLKDALKRVENRMDKGKGQIPGTDDEGFIEVKRKKLGGNNGGNTLKSVSVKPKIQYPPKGKQSTAWTPPRAGTNKASTSGHNEESPSNKVATGGKILEGKLALVDDDGKPPENVDYPDNSDNDDEVEPVQNETASFLALKGVRHDRKACGNNGGIQQ
ncbi:hypothetical protein Tco_0714377 [Tanacetum coccineum]